MAKEGTARFHRLTPCVGAIRVGEAQEIKRPPFRLSIDESSKDSPRTSTSSTSDAALTDRAKSAGRGDADRRDPCHQHHDD